MTAILSCLGLFVSSALLPFGFACQFVSALFREARRQRVYRNIDRLYLALRALERKGDPTKGA